MRYCDNLECDTHDEDIDRISDYVVGPQGVFCTSCYALHVEPEEIE